MNPIKRYALVGTGGRSKFFARGLIKDFADRGQLCAICDLNPLRMAAWQKRLQVNLPTYAPADFERMIADHQIDTVIVTSIDRTHHHYIARAMRAGCDVITEKPLTIDAPKCAEIIAAQHETGRTIRVAFNYRYAPRHSKVKELLQSGVIGEIFSVHFEWLLDTNHGADYFRRWHRDKRNGGGLLVHKATHHFDLVNWWINSTPQTVFAMGDLRFYGRDNAEARGEPRAYVRGTGDPATAGDPFALDLSKNEEMCTLYHECEAADGYRRDQNVFGDGISIEDDMGVMVRYRNRAVLTYHLTAYSPGEGYRVCFNGSRGRLELDVVETPYAKPGQGDLNSVVNVGGATALDIKESSTITLRPHWGPAQNIPLPAATGGGHGGADGLLLNDLFGEPGSPDPLGRAAGLPDGIASIMTGIAANRSLATGQPVEVANLLAEV